MPITNALYHVLFNGYDPKAAVDSLMARGKTNEMNDLINILGERYNEEE
jgi:glycerol-3-phosphate dehydrogenase (NAD(P)+)